ncbi:MAG: hypothetical protein ACREYF_17105 [Gammaproteobacteria bacterium]
MLPDHLHAIFSLPEGDADYALRLRLIKTGLSNNPLKHHALGASVSIQDRGSTVLLFPLKGVMLK